VDEETLKKVVALFGEDGVRVVEIPDIQIADQTEICLNTSQDALQTRDQETGWFVYHWRLQPDQLEGFIFNQKRRVLEKLETRLRYEKSHEFYSCQTQDCRPLPFEQAFKVLFRCPTCNKSFKS